MKEILFQYEPVNPTTWAYLSSLLMIALYFKFNRVLSVRNLDLILLILLAPALLMVQYGRDHGNSAVEHAGYIWLFSASGLFMLRLLLDAFMVRRPLLEPNLSAGGLTFLGISLFVFLMGNVVTGPADNLEPSRGELNSLSTHGPGFPLIFLLPQISTHSLLGEGGQDERVVAPNMAGEVAQVVSVADVVTARVMAILAQLAIVLGLVTVGVRHFDNVRTGIAAATLYLLMPYTAMWTGSVTHALPGALLVWAIVMYRQPLLAGAMVGLAFGTIYYPVFLLPLWISFYWQRGWARFLVGVFAMVAVLVVVLAWKSADLEVFLANMKQMFGVRWPVSESLSGVWREHWPHVYRYTVLVGYAGLCLSMALWPAQKNLGTLISYSAAVMLGTQFWHAHSGGLALAWYLPLLLLTTFRPNLEDRVAVSVVK
jgi:hypothetical protein